MQKCECGKPLSNAVDSFGTTYHTDDLDPIRLTPKTNSIPCFPQSCGYLLKELGGSLSELIEESELSDTQPPENDYYLDDWC